jgi:hypothetical protein
MKMTTSWIRGDWHQFNDNNVCMCASKKKWNK